MPRKSWSRLKRRPRMYVPAAGCARLCCVCVVRGWGESLSVVCCSTSVRGWESSATFQVCPSAARCAARSAPRAAAAAHGTARGRGAERGETAVGGTEFFSRRETFSISERCGDVPGAPLGARLRSAQGCTAPHRHAPLPAPRSCRARFRSSRASTGSDVARSGRPRAEDRRGAFGVLGRPELPGCGCAGAPARRSSADVTTPPPAA